MAQCDPCLKICDCVKKARDRDGVVRKNINISGDSLANGGSRMPIASTTQGRTGGVCFSAVTTHATSYNTTSVHTRFRCSSNKSNNAPSSPRPAYRREPLHECWDEVCEDTGHDHSRR
ncbi:hypothetical protein J6590_007520 [Homalodisca vitripennis]|nr:hypothetical protein J6590_007520 [Homalodisca vitripennis]